jgi:hypothetical protein
VDQRFQRRDGKARSTTKNESESLIH